MKPEIMEEKPMTMAQVKTELTAIKKRDKELNFRAERTQDYLNQFVMIDDKRAKELFDKIEALKIPRLKETHIVKIIDLNPQTREELKSILQGYTLTITQDNMKKIIDALTK